LFSGGWQTAIKAGVGERVCRQPRAPNSFNSHQHRESNLPASHQKITLPPMLHKKMKEIINYQRAEPIAQVLKKEREAGRIPFASVILKDDGSIGHIVVHCDRVNYYFHPSRDREGNKLETIVEDTELINGEKVKKFYQPYDGTGSGGICENPFEKKCPWS
jgi:hypothetical protein